MSSFPLGDLPHPALALVLLWLPMREAAEQACVSKRFAVAFRDNVSWQKRCHRDVKDIAVEATFATEKAQSWLHFYMRHTSYKI